MCSRGELPFAVGSAASHSTDDAPGEQYVGERRTTKIDGGDPSRNPARISAMEPRAVGAVSV